MTKGTGQVNRRVVLAVCCLSVCVTGIDITIVNVALPSIGRDLHASVSELQWTLDAYTLVISCLLILSGSLADRFGRKRAFQTGLVLFSVSSALCGLAPSVGWLIAFRALQAIGGSLLNPVAMSIIVATFTDPKQRARAVGVWGSTIGVTIAAGPVIGGVLVSAIDWRSIFWVNVPVGIIAILLARRYIPESKARRARAFDPAGQVLIVVLFAAIITAIIEGPRIGWGSATTIGLGALAALALVGVIVVEPQRREPLIDLRFFRSPPFSGANLIALAMSAALGGFLFLNTLYLQDVRHLSPLHAGLSIIPLAAGQGLAANISGRLIAARGARLPLTIGSAMIALGGFLLIPLTARTALVDILAVYALFGLGAGLAAAPVTNTAVSGLPRDQAGVAGALASSGRQFGVAIGVAVTGSIINNTGAGFIHSSHAVWTVLGGCGVLALLLGAFSTSRRAQAAADRNGRRLAAENSAGHDAVQPTSIAR